MKSVRTRIIVLLLLFCLFLSYNVVYAVEDENEKQNGYSKLFQEWLELPDEEKKDTIAPLPFTINKKSSKNSNNGLYITKSGNIPVKYDLRNTLREKGIELEVKNQMNTGECWAFSANSTLETNLALQDQIYNFSERHLEYDTAKHFKDGINSNALSREVGDGGYSSTAFTYYSRGSGPIFEDDMPFENNENKILLRDLPQDACIKKVDNMVYFPTILKEIDENNNITFTDGDSKVYTETEVEEIRNQVKEHIMTYGAVTTSIFATNNGNPFFNNTYASSNVSSTGFRPNHAVTIIGWDDTFSKSKFPVQPHNNGAYIVLNSWDTTFGKQGVYYISYEDVWVEYQLRGVTDISNVNYDRIYQHDNQELFYTTDDQYAANVFTAESNEILNEVMIGTWDNQTCNVYINNDGDNLNINNLTLVASNVSIKPGYNTIKLANPVELTEGHKFAVVVNIIDYESHSGIAAEGYYAEGGHVYSDPESHENETFCSNDGITWEDVYDENSKLNYSIKAFTQRPDRYVNIAMNKYEVQFEGDNSIQKETLKYRVSRDLDGKELNVNVYDSNNVNVTSSFDINTIAVDHRLGKTIVETKNNTEPGDYDIQFSYDSENLLSYVFTVRSIDNYDRDVYMKLHFDDEKLYEALKATLSLDDLFIYSDVTKDIIVRKDVKSLDLSNTDEYGDAYGYDLKTIDGLENFTELEYLNLMGNPILSLEPLENLQHIKYFYAHGYNMFIEEMYWEEFEEDDLLTHSDVIKNWTGLIELSVENCGINDFSFLDNSRELTYLNVANNEITDVSFINNLTQLRTLVLDENDINDYSFIDNLDRLENLSMRSCKIDDLTLIGEHLNNISNLKYLVLDWNKISYIPEVFVNSLLASTDLEEIDLCGNSIKDARAFNRFKDRDVILNLSDQVIYIDIQFRKTNIIELPMIFQQQNDENDIFYTTPAFGYTEIPEIYGCEWYEEKKSVKLTETPKYYTETSYTPAGGGMSYIHDHHEIAFARIGKTKANLLGATLRLNIDQAELDPHIYIEQSPYKTDYNVGESFNSDGLEVGYMDENGYQPVNSFTIENGISIDENQTSVIISAVYNNKVYSVEQPISVTKLVEINYSDDNFGNFLYYKIGVDNAVIDSDLKKITVTDSVLEDLLELEIDIDYEAINDITGIRSLFNLRKLYLTGKGKYIQGFNELQYLKELNEIVLDNVKSSDIRIINKIEKLKSISFYNIIIDTSFINNPSVNHITVTGVTNFVSERETIMIPNGIINLHSKGLINIDDIDINLYLTLRSNLELDYDNGKKLRIIKNPNSQVLYVSPIYKLTDEDEDKYEEYSNRRVLISLHKEINGVKNDIDFSFNYRVTRSIIDYVDDNFARVILRNCHNIGEINYSQKRITTHRNFLTDLSEFRIEKGDQVIELYGIESFTGMQKLVIQGDDNSVALDNITRYQTRFKTLCLEDISIDEIDLRNIVNSKNTMEYLQLDNVEINNTTFINSESITNEKLKRIALTNSKRIDNDPKEMYLPSLIYDLYKNHEIEKEDIQVSMYLPLKNTVGVEENDEGIILEVEEKENQLYLNLEHELTEEENNKYEELGARQILIKIEKNIDSRDYIINYNYNYNVFDKKVEINFVDDNFGAFLYEKLGDNSQIDYTEKKLTTKQSVINQINDLVIDVPSNVQDITGINKFTELSSLWIGGQGNIVYGLNELKELENLEELSLCNIKMGNNNIINELNNLKVFSIYDMEFDILDLQESINTIHQYNNYELEKEPDRIYVPDTIQQLYTEGKIQKTEIKALLKLEYITPLGLDTGDEGITLDMQETEDGKLYVIPSHELTEEEKNIYEEWGSRQILIKIEKNIDSRDYIINYNYNYNVFDEDVEINFVDDNFGAFLYEKLGDNSQIDYTEKKLTTKQSVIDQINDLVIDVPSEVQDITGINKFTELSRLWIGGQGNIVYGLNELKELENLEELSLCNIKMENNNIINELNNLKVFSIYDMEFDILDLQESIDTIHQYNNYELEKEPDRIYVPDTIQQLYTEGKIQKTEIKVLLKLEYILPLGIDTGDKGITLDIQETEDGKLYVIPSYELTEEDEGLYKEFGNRNVKFSINKTIDDVTYYLNYNNRFNYINYKMDYLEINNNKIIVLEPLRLNDLLTETYFNNINCVSVKDMNGNDLSIDDKIGTGSIISVYNNDENIIETYVVSVLGDLDSDGSIDMFDILRLIELVMDENNNVWTDILKIAGNCYKEGNEIDIPDMQDILRLIEYYYDNVEW